MLFLNTNQRADLEAQLRKTKDLSEWKRIFSILGYDESQSLEELSIVLRLSRHTIEKYLQSDYSKNKTKNDPRGGSQSKLSSNETEKLKDHLVKKTYLKVKSVTILKKPITF